MSAQSEPNALKPYYDSLRNDLWEQLNVSEEGGTYEQAFTQYVINLLAEAGEVENARECRDEESVRPGRHPHKINGYSLSENLETVQLFNTIIKSTDEVSRVYTAEINAAFKATARFLKNALNHYVNDMEPSAPAFDFACELDKNGKDIERAELFVFTDGECDVPKPDDELINNVLVTYRIIDIRYLMRLEGGQPDPVEIDFEESCGQPIPCLVVPDKNEQYQSYLAVVPGNVLADVYKKHGAKLLEMNVRSFLQFTAKVNKGIRQTIKEEPHMFLAFNNGIAATATSVVLVDHPEGGKAIRSIQDLQIVNGGQTTASILHTRQKDKAVVDQVFVQMKLSVIRDQAKFHSVVSRISEYANTQNKVSFADLSSNSPFHIEIERLSRAVWASPQAGANHQTRWFYERARGQYKNEAARQLTAKQQKVFAAHNPKSQLLVKEDMAKYVNLWAGLPHHVVRGNQKNFAEFVKSLKTKKDHKPDSIFFEDLIAKAILFRTAEKIYGVKPNALGDLRYITVPYTIAYLNLATNNRLNLLKIWKQQSISDALKHELQSLMIQIEAFIKTNAPGSLYGEWAKKADCWDAVRNQKFTVDSGGLSADLSSPAELAKRLPLTDDKLNEIATATTTVWLKSIPISAWQAVDNWGATTSLLNAYKRNIVQEIIKKIKTNQPLTEFQLKNGPEIIELVLDNAPELLQDFYDTDSGNSPTPTDDKQNAPGSDPIAEVLLTAPELWRKVASWGRSTNELPQNAQGICVSMAQIVAKGNKPTPRQATFAIDVLKTARERGFGA